MTTRDEPIVDTQYGRLRGQWIDGSVQRFTGIPFAAPPTGEHRFLPPRDPEPWDGVRDATEFGPICPQPDSSSRSYISKDDMDEDCLRLNVWTPETDGNDRPVMVWVHGGGFMAGAGNDPRVDGTAFADRGDVVLVTVQYRLSTLGGLSLEHLGGEEYASSHNNHLLDQRQALRWVRENIEVFGGNPENVTVFGESAGGTSVSSLLVSRDAEELVDKVIAHSGGLRRLRTPERARKITDDFLESAGLDGLDDLLALSTEELRQATITFLKENSEVKANLFRPVRDSNLLPHDPFEYIADGDTADIPVMHGSNEHEFNWYTRAHPDEMAAFTVEELKRKLRDHYPLSAEDIETMVRAVREANPDESEAQVCFDVITQNRYREDHRRLAEARVGAGESWHYLFGWESPVGSLRAAHTMELPFVFHNLDGGDLIRETVGENPPRHLADLMQDTWVAFARHGDPNHENLPEWPVYDTDDHPMMVFDDETRHVDDPEAVVRRAWKAVGLPTYTTPVPTF